MRHSKLVVTVASVCLALSTEALAAFKAQVKPEPNPPDAGDNVMVISLSNEKGEPVEGADLKLIVSMPAMGTMPYMEEKATIAAKGKGVYAASFYLSMGGTWEVALDVAKGGEKAKYLYSITTGIPDIKDKTVAHRLSAKDSGETTDVTLLEVGRERLQKIGVRFAEVKNAPLTKTIRSVGVIEQDKTHREEITLRYSGYIVKQLRGRVGDYVKRGEPLLTVYSPELVTAQTEFILALKYLDSDRSLFRSAEERLENLGLSKSDIAIIRKTGKPIRDVTVRSTIGGTVLEVNGREGTAVNPGQVLYVIGDLSKSFIVGRVFQQDISQLAVRQPVEVIVPDSDEAIHKGKVDLVYPEIEQGAGTGNVRVVVEEYAKSLRPGTYVELRFPVELGEKLVIPVEAVLYSGLHTYVFVDKGEGALEPREIVLGRQAGDVVAVSQGLQAGERIAASGTFLLSSEAQLRSALPKWKKP